MYPSQSLDFEMVRAQVADKLMDGNLGINGSQDRILGELIYEAKGKIVGQRVADIGNSNNDDHDRLAKVEVSYSGKGYIKGVGNVSETWTFVNTHLLNGTTQGAGKGIITSGVEKGVVTATEIGRGFNLEPGKIVYPGSPIFLADPGGKFSFLNEVVGVTDWTVDDSGNYSHKKWQWK